MQKKVALKPQSLYLPALTLVLLIGIAFRVYALFIVGFDEPFDLGGLFYQMSIEIAHNDFTLPVSIQYYYPGGLPFAYPPLAFYLQAILIRLFSPRLFITVNLLPAVFSIMSLFAFHFLAKEVIKERWLSLQALFIFAIIPLAVTEQVQAMGLAESMGTTALILYTWALMKVGRQKHKRMWLLAGLLLSLCVVSSPGSLYAAVLISFLFFVVAIHTWVVQKNIGGIVGCFVIGLVGLIVSSPYWFSVISNHGAGIFLDAFTGQNSVLLSQLIKNFLALRVIWVTPLWNIVFLLSLALVLFRRQYLLVIYTLLMLMIIRERWIVSIATSLVISNGIGIFLDMLGMFRLKKINLIKVSAIWILALFLIFDAGSYLHYIIQDDTYDLPAPKVLELQQINALGLIPSDQTVVSVGSWGMVEWSPALLERTVINNPYGLEWIPGRDAEIFALNRILQTETDPIESVSLIKQEFPESQMLYLVVDNMLIEQGVLGIMNSEQLQIIKVFDELTLGLLVLQDVSH